MQIKDARATLRNVPLTSCQNCFDVRLSAGFSEQLHFGVKRLPIWFRTCRRLITISISVAPAATLSISAMRSFSGERPLEIQLIPLQQGFGFLTRQQQQQEPFRDKRRPHQL